MADEQNLRFEIEIPDELQAGVYANLLNVWHSPYEFTLDFAVIHGNQAREEDDEQVVPARVVSRVRIPPNIMFEVLKALNSNLSKYEANIAQLQRQQSESDDEGAE